MTERNGFLARMKALPVMFPLVGLFHFVMLLIAIWQFAQHGVLGSPMILAELAHWVVYGGIWAIICLRESRWAALAYIALTSIELILQFYGPPGMLREVSDTLFPFSILLCFFLLFYYKRFR